LSVCWQISSNPQTSKFVVFFLFLSKVFF
jgi:hypothetical protein